MSDVLLEIAKRPGARRLVQRIGLPLPMPEPLERAAGPWRARELAGREAAIALRGPLTEGFERALLDAGAEVRSELGPEGRAAILIADASGIDDVPGLRALYDALHPAIPRLARSGRVIVFGRPPGDARSAGAAASRRALDGFVRSVAKEIGRRGSTANLVTIAEGAEARAEGPLCFLASARSAFVTAQPLHVDGRAREIEGAARLARSLDGKVALVTGAARGIGAAIARRLADEGAHVVLLDRPEDERETLEVARSIGGSTLSADVTDPEAPARIARALRDAHGGVDVVVHNAGITRDRTLAKMSAREWDQPIAVNLGAVVRITGELLQGAVLRPGGRVILLSSIAGLAGNVGQSSYAASKAGVAGYARALAPEVASQGITVNAIAPGFVETRLTAAIPLVIREAGRRLSALGQGGLPDDVAQLAAFLAMPASQGLTGQVVRACGGALVGA